jgi:molybdenum cofactor biosynthesis enzyme MoaA
MNSRCISSETLVGLEGGEFLLHPEYREILLWFKENHPQFDLLSNCLLPERVIEAVKNYSPKRLYVSLDGNRDVYHYMRGCDGYDKVIKVIETCKDIVPVSLMFTLSPYNDFSDMEEIVDLAEKYNTDIRIGIYNNIDFFETKENAHEDARIANSENVCFRDKIPANVAHTSENLDFLYLYDEWLQKKLKIKCFSYLRFTGHSSQWGYPYLSKPGC